jgi:hypothetical protein
MRPLRAFGRFWYDLVVGDDWRIAAGVTAVLAAGGAAVMAGLGSALLVVVLFVGLVAAFVAPILRDGRPGR